MPPKRKTKPLSEKDGALKRKKATVKESEVAEEDSYTEASVKEESPGDNSMAGVRPGINQLSLTKWVGAHVSVAKGLHQAVYRTLEIHGQSFALFLKSQRRWDNPPLALSAVEAFHTTCTKHAFNPSSQVLPHGSYLINLGNPDTEKRLKSYNAFVDDLKRCEKLGIGLYNFHPGSTVGECTIDESIQHIGTCINQAHAETSKVTIVLENMAGQGNVVGSKFEELNSIISRVSNKGRIGVCLDTCHLFSAGYDIRTPEAFDRVLKEFDRVVGLHYLKGIHLNDSKGELNSRKDRHENIGKGYIGLPCFKFIMNDPRFDSMPLILETPAPEHEEHRIYKQEIELLYSLIDQ